MKKSLWACRIACAADVFSTTQGKKDLLEYFVAFTTNLLLLSMQVIFQNAYYQDPYAKEFGLKISDKLASVEARILPAPWVLIPSLPFILFLKWLVFVIYSKFSLFHLCLTVNATILVQLKYHETSREKDCLPQVG